MEKLRDRQAAFIREYLIDLNATAAYKRAGYSAKGHSAESAAERLLRNVEVKAAIAAALKARAEQTNITAKQILDELALIAFADQRNFCTWGPSGLTLSPSDRLGDNARAVAEISQDGEKIKFKLHDKVAALTLLGKHLGLFPNKVEHDHNGEVKLQVREVLIERAKPSRR